MATAAFQIRGLHVWPGYLDRPAQESLVSDLRKVAEAAPFVTPVTPGGRQMSVRMTAAGRLGWVTDRRGYRYQPQHPSGAAWPPVPPAVLAIWRDLTGLSRDPDCCLVNFYDSTARMGLHQDRDEGDFSFPVLSVSLGGADRGEGTQSFWLRSGDVLLMGGSARLAWHGVDRIRPASSTLLPQGGRINLTCRVVTKV